MARKPALATNAAKATLAVAPAVAKTAKAKTATARPAPGADRLDGEKRYFLMKTEPTTFSLADLKSKKDCIEPWEGVRNYAARNHMLSMRKGDEAFFYHSSCAEPGIMATVEIVREGHPDPSQFDKKSKYYDAKATEDEPRWFQVDVQLKRTFKQPILLHALRQYQTKELANMLLLSKTRLSVQPVAKDEWDFIVGIADKAEGKTA